MCAARAACTTPCCAVHKTVHQRTARLAMPWLGATIGAAGATCKPSMLQARNDSGYNSPYFLITICYIDDGWDLRKKILGIFIEFSVAEDIINWGKQVTSRVNSFSESKSQTVNVYFPMFCDTYAKLLQWEGSKYKYVKGIASEIKEEALDEHWKKCGMALTIAAVLELRFKMEIVESWYKEMYGNDSETQLKTFSDHLAGVNL
ncbi:hypothetical protein Dsin_018398 [Dipteronia sinensis]|uniref:hAT-like transposase RNase-H fold domain-containing protein n=1 Tax=Dipteronia sinensis TaxID=43782 RepID=A0AAE0A5U0_9ROSI|nr:hypothetical protein Dsin_018398 [Dipteronia sinensis]